MEFYLKPVSVMILFAILAIIIAAFPYPGSPSDSREQGVWRGRINTVTAAGAMLDCVDGTFWVSDTALCSTAIKGDSLLVLGVRNGRFITSYGSRIRYSTSLTAAARRGFMIRLRETISNPTVRGLTGGLLMGLRGMIPRDTASLFQRSGVSHLLALSGLHTALVASILSLFSTLIMGRRPSAKWLVSLGILAFVALSGARASTVRAGIMSISTILYLGFRGGKIHMLTVWWAAAIISGAFYPGILHDPGAQLSFGAVLSLILMGKSYSGRLAFLFTPIHAGVTVTLALAPLLMSLYGRVTITGPIATVVSLPFMILTMILGAVAVMGLPAVNWLLQQVTQVWLMILETMGSYSFSPAGKGPTALWFISLLLLRVHSKWNGFNRRLR